MNPELRRELLHCNGSSDVNEPQSLIHRDERQVTVLLVRLYSIERLRSVYSARPVSLKLHSDVLCTTVAAARLQKQNAPPTQREMHEMSIVYAT